MSEQRVTAQRSTDGLRELPLIMSDEVASQIAAMGRTEDVVLSPNGRRLAIAAINSHEIVLIDFEVEHDTASGRPTGVFVRSALNVGCRLMARPHGVSWLDDTHILVGNREAEVLLIGVPAEAGGRDRIEVDGRVVIDGASAPAVSSPGSVLAVGTGSGLAEVLTCNNYVHNVSRHVLNVDAPDTECPIVDGERLLEAGMNLPDGVALSASREWLAISNHNTNSVLLYRYDADLGATSIADGQALKVNYPHSLRFTESGRFLLVADAGLPFIHVYEAGDGDWSGSRRPVRSVRVMDDDTFNAARSNPQEGGPKGLEVIDRDRVVVVTSEAQSLGFFDLFDFVDEPQRVDDETRATSARAAEARTVQAIVERLSRRHTEQAAADAVRTTELEAELVALHQRVGEQDAQSSELRHQLAECEQRVTAAESERAAAQAASLQQAARVDAVHASTAWRITAPLRRVADRLHR